MYKKVNKAGFHIMPNRIYLQSSFTGLLANSNTAWIKSHYRLMLFQHKFTLSKEKLVDHISAQQKIERELFKV